MNLLIVGGTGTLGRQVVRQALDEGYQVHCLVRSPRKASFLKEWGAHLIQGDLCEPETLKAALSNVSAVIDAATTRPNDTLSIRQVDWEGKVALIQAAEAVGIERFIFFSIMRAEKFPHVPLMDIKRCTEELLQKSSLNYTILRPAGFYQGLIGQYAIPVLEQHSVWLMNEANAVAFMDTQDIARFAISALSHPETAMQTFDLAGPKAWSPDEIVKLCERLSGKDAKIARMPLKALRGARKLARFFEWTWNVADRLAFTEVLVSGQPLNASMDQVYPAFEIDAKTIVTLEAYMQDYFSRILKKLKEIDYQKSKRQSSKRSPFKSS
ncbi:NAD(P)H-binding protein [Synechococcales cyanobacterium C]|uniref:NAD(P)H-binding protein n=1 Tax=Petrachloros mirabilis ULC683 TaxID=2781853 RepID=A0A8K1ZY64_9CYAN|nr:SDR family oxidoreductase [Petrachloros mirabilis]NCJ05812.1 NAD(P)H-binding protein [Petrachloros mirabilis ULC683]